MKYNQRITLFAVRLEALREAWSSEPLERACAASPRGRLAALVKGTPAVRAQPPQAALAALGPALVRRAWSSLLEDRAAAALYDAPVAALAEVFAAIVHVSKRRDLELAHLEQTAEPTNPPELAASANAPACAVWLGASEAAAARTALISALSLPVGAFPTREPNLFRDLAESLAPVLEAAARPRHSLVAARHDSPV